MDGSNSCEIMYKLQRPFDLPEVIPAPDCMYKLSSTTPTPCSADYGYGSSEETSKCHEETDDVSKQFKDLINRQETIIKKLKDLQNAVGKIHNEFSKTRKRCNDTFSAVSHSEVVIKADPDHPPYALLYMQKLLEDSHKVQIPITTYMHSSYDKPLPEPAKLFGKEAAQPSKFQNTQPALQIYVIWRKADTNRSGSWCEMIVDPLKQHPIHGEGNVCRFLSRLLKTGQPSNYDLLDWPSLIKVDSLLSLADNIACSRSRAVEVTDAINSTLDETKSTYFLPGGASIADFVLYSALLNSSNFDKAISVKNAVCNWADSVEKLGGVSLKKQLMNC